MAKIVLGMVASHGPLLGTPPELWTGRVKADMMNPALAFRGKTYSFGELKAARAHEDIEPQIELAVRQQRYDSCQRAIKEMARVFHDVKPDVAILLGNDQMEIMSDDNQPLFMIYHGETIANVPFSEAQKKLLGPGVEIAEPNHHPPQTQVYPGHPALGLHLVKSLVDDEFDVASSARLPEQPNSRLTGIPHAYGFFYRRVMEDRAIPSVPIFTNTFYPPNRPSAARCLKFGAAIARAVERWDSDLRVAILGSGGMSHFVVDEEFDRAFLAAFASEGTEKILSFPDDYYRSGTSELKNWIPLKSAMSYAKLRMTHVDYQPLYRSVAGTGSGMGFAYWR